MAVKSEYKIELHNDHFQNFKRYNIPKAQLIIADIPYNLGNNAYASNPQWYKDGDNSNGESALAGKSFFDTDNDFRVAEYMHFCSKLLKPEPKETGKAPAMIVFCAFEQMHMVIEEGKKYGFNNSYPLFFIKNFSGQVLKANMKIVGATEFAVVLYREKLPKFNNYGKMIFNWFDWERDNKTPKVHPCLPSGNKVYFNNEWINIENVQIGDKNRYGEVIDVSSHDAEKIVTIEVDGLITTATWNHPFLIKRSNNILWAHAENLAEGDYLLTSASVYDTLKPYKFKKGIPTCVKQLKKVISEHKEMRMVDYGLNIISFGKNIMEKSHWVCKYTIKTLTKKTIILKICNLSHPLNTSGFTQVVDLSTENGLNLALFVQNIKNVIKKIGIFREDGLMGDYAKNASVKNPLKLEKFLLQKVGSVKITQKKTKVYNLTMDSIPVFDTFVGLSHNTQKPIGVLKRLIQIFTDEGDVIIDPVAGSGTTLRAAYECNRNSYGFEIKKDFFKLANEKILTNLQKDLF